MPLTGRLFQKLAGRETGRESTLSSGAGLPSEIPSVAHRGLVEYLGLLAPVDALGPISAGPQEAGARL